MAIVKFLSPRSASLRIDKNAQYINAVSNGLPMIKTITPEPLRFVNGELFLDDQIEEEAEDIEFLRKHRLNPAMFFEDKSAPVEQPDEVTDLAKENAVTEDEEETAVDPKEEETEESTSETAGITTVNEAKNYLIDNYGCTTREVGSRKMILDKAKELGIEFPGL